MKTIMMLQPKTGDILDDMFQKVRNEFTQGYMECFDDVAIYVNEVVAEVLDAGGSEWETLQFTFGTRQAVCQFLCDRVKQEWTQCQLPRPGIATAKVCMHLAVHGLGQDSMEDIARATGLPTDEIHTIAKKNAGFVQQLKQQWIEHQKAFATDLEQKWADYHLPRDLQ